MRPLKLIAYPRSRGRYRAWMKAGSRVGHPAAKRNQPALGACAATILARADALTPAASATLPAGRPEDRAATICSPQEAWAWSSAHSAASTSPARQATAASMCSCAGDKFAEEPDRVATSGECNVPRSRYTVESTFAMDRGRVLVSMCGFTTAAFQIMKRHSRWLERRLRNKQDQAVCLVNRHYSPAGGRAMGAYGRRAACRIEAGE